MNLFSEHVRIDFREFDVGTIHRERIRLERLTHNLLEKFYIDLKVGSFRSVEQPPKYLFGLEMLSLKLC